MQFQLFISDTISDISLSLLFQQVIVSANIALTSWSSNNTVTLAALELLSGLATLHFDSQSM